MESVVASGRGPTLEGLTVYSTLEACVMCTGTMLMYEIDRYARHFCGFIILLLF